jgi:hypothetical protein
VLDWIDGELARLGAERAGEPEEQRSTPWSIVTRVPTSDGVVWFKSVAAQLRHEVAVTEAVAAWAPEDVLGPLAADPERGFLLFPDGGPVVRAASAPPWPEVLARYGRFQRAVAPHAGELLRLGALDRRPESLPGQYEAILGRRPESGRLRDTQGAFEEACARLALLPPTIDHGDFHDGNVFADGRIFDWGDAAVAHPFFTAVIALQEEPEASRDAFLEPWEELAPRAELLAQLDDALWVGKVARALTWQEVVDRLGLSHKEHDPVSAWLLWFLAEAPG